MPQARCDQPREFTEVLGHGFGRVGESTRLLAVEVGQLAAQSLQQHPAGLQPEALTESSTTSSPAPRTSSGSTSPSTFNVVSHGGAVPAHRPRLLRDEGPTTGTELFDHPSHDLGVGESARIEALQPVPLMGLWLAVITIPPSARVPGS